MSKIFEGQTVNERFYARDVNVVSDVKAVSRRLERLTIKTENKEDAFNVCLL